MSVIFDADFGDVRARASVLCSHGREGYCADDALPGEREAIDFLYQHAYDYALPYDRELAESYAAWTVAQAWHPGVVTMEGSHGREFQRFLSL